MKALRVTGAMKREAADHPEAPPAQIIRKLDMLPSEVLSEMPDRENIRKSIQRERLRGLPKNPTTIEELGEIPLKFKKTLEGDLFLLYDSFEDENADDDDESRIIIFSTLTNLRRLSKSKEWHLDGTFKMSPSIFFQLFTILGSEMQIIDDEEQNIALPYVYALLRNKQEITYAKVLQIVIHKIQEFFGDWQVPEIIMTDFELGIINSVKNVVKTNVKACFFHLRQSVYRRIQSEGLQQEYNNPNDRSIKIATQKMVALAFLPIEEVVDTFDDFYDEVPESFLPIADYFEVDT